MGNLMKTFKVVLGDLKEAIRTRNFKDMNKYSRNILIMFAIVFSLVIITAYLVTEGDTSNQEALSQGFEKVQEESQEGQDEYTAPQIDGNTANAEANANPANNMPPTPANPFVTNDKDKSTKGGKDKDKDQFNIPDISGQNLSQQEQEEMIRQIAKSQKPADMIAFLKEAQSKFDFLKTQKRFKYDLKNYQVGDIFLWWEIEEITPIYIRFKDNDYSYNLRFLED